MATLQLHLSPHFMFNALSSVQWKLQDGQVRQAQLLFQSFVELWQHHWNETEASMHSLHEEVKSLNQYVILECWRIDTSIQWHVDIQDEALWSHQVPSLLFQPAIENAIWHGFPDQFRTQRFISSSENCPHNQGGFKPQFWTMASD